MQMTTNRPNGRILAFSATALLTAATTFAQVKQPVIPAQGANSNVEPYPMAGDATGLGPNSSAAASFADKAFVLQVFESDAAELKLGHLALQKSQSSDVKQLAQSIVDARIKLEDQFAPIAKALDVSKPKEPVKKDRQLISKLEELSGPQFDEEYIKAVARGNQKDVKVFNTEAQSAQYPTLLQAVKQDSGVLAQHQQVVQQVAQKHNVNIDAKN
jgi:putative membrane protein